MKPFSSWSESRVPSCSASSFYFSCFSCFSSAFCQSSSFSFWRRSAPEGWWRPWPPCRGRARVECGEDVGVSSQLQAIAPPGPHLEERVRARLRSTEARSCFCLSLLPSLLQRLQRLQRLQHLCRRRALWGSIEPLLCICIAPAALPGQCHSDAYELHCQVSEARGRSVFAEIKPDLLRPQAFPEQNSGDVGGGPCLSKTIDHAWHVMGDAIGDKRELQNGDGAISVAHEDSQPVRGWKGLEAHMRAKTAQFKSAK